MGHERKRPPPLAAAPGFGLLRPLKRPGSAQIGAQMRGERKDQCSRQSCELVKWCIMISKRCPKMSFAPFGSWPSPIEPSLHRTRMNSVHNGNEFSGRTIIAPRPSPTSALRWIGPRTDATEAYLLPGHARHLPRCDRAAWVRPRVQDHVHPGIVINGELAYTGSVSDTVQPDWTRGVNSVQPRRRVR